MNRSRSFRFGVAPAILAIVLVLPVTALAAHLTPGLFTDAHARRQAATGFQFGQKAGNIRPWTVSIAPDGTIQATGIGVRDPKLQFATSTINALNKLAIAERLTAFPQTTLCRGVSPDVASRFVMLQSATMSRSVTVHGTCKGAFNQMFATLYAVADIVPHAANGARDK